MFARAAWHGLVVALLAALCAGWAPAAAEEPETDEDQRTLGSDPSEIVSRIEIRNEYLALPEGGHSNATIFRGDWAPTDWMLGRVEIPLVTADTEEFGSDVGMGDMLIGLRGKRRLGERWSVLGELAFVLDTAGSDALGSGHNAVSPFAVVVWKPSPAWILGLEYRWLGSFDGESDREAIRESEIRPQALRHLPRGFWLLADPRIYVNHVGGNTVAFFPEVEFGKVLARHVELWVRGGGNVAGGGREEREDWVAEMGVRYLFD
jgi:hypothetical protein